MINDLSFKDVRKYIQSEDPKLLNSIDKLLSIVIVGSSIFFGSEALKLISAKNELVKAGNDLLKKIGRIGNHDFVTKLEKMETAYCLMCYATFFEALENVSPNILKKIDMTLENKKAISKEASLGNCTDDFSYYSIPALVDAIGVNDNNKLLVLYERMTEGFLKFIELNSIQADRNINKYLSVTEVKKALEGFPEKAIKCFYDQFFKLFSENEDFFKWILLKHIIENQSTKDKIEQLLRKSSDNKTLNLNNINKNSNDSRDIESEIKAFEICKTLKKIKENSKVYFNKLTGINGRFRHINIVDSILVGNRFLNTDIQLKESSMPLEQVVKKLWERECWHGVLVGAGGMGKTISSIRLWNQLVVESDTECPVPVFLPLNQYNISEERKGFIFKSICEYYYGTPNLSSEDENIIKNALNHTFLKNGIKIPSFLLILDGFNEIIKEKASFYIELNKLIESYSGIQVIITSRYDMRDEYQWTGFCMIESMPLTYEAVSKYLGEQCPAEDNKKLINVLQNPMMLTIYASNCEMIKQNRDTGFDFRKYTITAGELLWNYIECQLLKISSIQPDKLHFCTFILKHLLPYIAYQMERRIQFHMDCGSLEQWVNEAFESCYEENYIKAFDYLREGRKNIPFKAEGWDDKEDRLKDIKNILIGHLKIVVEEGENQETDSINYLFVHQNFRDYFAAQYILNEITVCLNSNNAKLPNSLLETQVSFYVRKFIGEIEGEHYNVPVKDELIQGWSKDHFKSTKLVNLLDRLRGKYDDKCGIVVWNIIEIWKDVRGELTGADLSRLNLRDVCLNMVTCSRAYGDKILGTIFDYSLIDENNILPQGHSSDIWMAAYSDDDTRIVSLSSDGGIKQWDVLSGKCARTYIDETLFFAGKSLMYSRSGKKILFPSEKDIKEWDAVAGKCLRTYTGHKYYVLYAVYNYNEEKILSASMDKTIKEWDTKTGSCLKTYEGHSDTVRKAVYIDEEKRILSVSNDLTVKEWDSVSGKILNTFSYKGPRATLCDIIYRRCDNKIKILINDNQIKEWDIKENKLLQTYSGHWGSGLMAKYSMDGRKVLTAFSDYQHSDYTIKEWDSITGECIQKYKGHSSRIVSMVYSCSGKKVLSASRDKMIKEWDTLTAECIRTYQGQYEPKSMASAVFSGDGKRILSASDRDTINEWDISTGKCLKTFKGHTSSLNSVVYCGKVIESESADDTINVWNAITGEYIRTFDCQAGCLKTVVSSKDGTRILSTLTNPGVITEFLNKKPYRTYKGHYGGLYNVVFSFDEKRVIAVSRDSVIEVWNADTGEFISSYDNMHGLRISGLYSSDGIDILCACIKDNFIEVVNACTRESLCRIEYVSGLIISGCTFRHLHPDSIITQRGKEILITHGGIIE